MSQRDRIKGDMMRLGTRALVALTLCAIGFLTSATDAAAQDVGPFFSGRTIKILVGTGAGRGYDAYARLVARHLGRHMPGQPNFVVESMPGASGIRALNYLYAAAPNDGTVIATFNSAIPFYEAIGQAGIRFKSEELSWIGSLSQGASVIAVWHTAGVRTLDDARRLEVILGATGAAGAKATYPTVMNNTLGTRFKIVTGYEGGNAVTLAIERSEVQGDGNSRWSSWKATRPDWVRERKIIALVQFGLKRDPDLPGVALLTDAAQSDEQRQMFAFVSAPNDLGQPFAAPPRVPADRLAAIRRAFEAMAGDPAFRAEAEAAKLEPGHLAGEEAERLVRLIVGTPAAIVQKVQAATAVKAPDGRPVRPDQ